MQPEIDDPAQTRVLDPLRQCIVKFEIENGKIKAENDKIRAENLELKAENLELKAENLKLKAENLELKARIAKLEDKQLQNEMAKNLLSISCDKNR